MPLYRRRRLFGLRRRRYSMRRRRVSNYRRLRRRYRSRAIATTRGIRGAMMKWVDFDFFSGGGSGAGALDTYLPCTSSGSIITINNPGLGDAFNQRNGYRIKMLYLDINLYITTTGNTASQYQNDVVRFAVIYDRQPNGLNPNVYDIFAGNTNSATLNYPSMCNMNLLNRDRFLILADKKKLLEEWYDATMDSAWNNHQAISTTANLNMQASPAPTNNHHIRKNIKLRGLETLFKGNAGGIGDISTGALYLYTAAIAPAVANPGHVSHGKYCLSGLVRLKFVDA